MSRIVTCLDCPMYQTGGYCRHKKKDVGALQPACDYALTINDKFNPEDKTDILPEAPQTKTCRNCGRTLTLDNFYTNKGKPNSTCKDCKKEEVKRYRKPKEAKTARRTTEQPLRIAVRETLTDQQMVDLREIRKGGAVMIRFGTGTTITIGWLIFSLCLNIKR